MTEFTILVSGSRTWDRVDVVEETLRILMESALSSGFDRVVFRHGACTRGADAIADYWVRRESLQAGAPIRVDRWPADWIGLGKRAGYARNLAMVQTEPIADVCVVFVRDHSAGASNCAELAERAGIAVQILDYDDIPAVEEVSP